MHRPKTLRDIGWRLPNVLIGETGSITASRTQSHTEAVESDEKHKEAIGSVPNRLPMACRPVPTSRPQGLNGKERGELLAMAIFWDFLAEHCPHHPANEIG